MSSESFASIVVISTMYDIKQNIESINSSNIGSLRNNNGGAQSSQYELKLYPITYPVLLSTRLTVHEGIVHLIFHCLNPSPEISRLEDSGFSTIIRILCYNSADGPFAIGDCVQS